MSTSLVITEMIDDVAEFLDGQVDDLRSFLDDVVALGQEAAPAPDAELVRLLAGASAIRPVVRRPVVPRPVRIRRRLAGLSAAAVAGLSLTGAAALANELPASLQRAVAHFSESYLPFDLPRPVGDARTVEPHAVGPVGEGTSTAPGADVGSNGTALPTGQSGQAHGSGPGAALTASPDVASGRTASGRVVSGPAKDGGPARHAPSSTRAPSSDGSSGDATTGPSSVTGNAQAPLDRSLGGSGSGSGNAGQGTSGLPVPTDRPAEHSARSDSQDSGSAAAPGAGPDGASGSTTDRTTGGSYPSGAAAQDNMGDASGASAGETPTNGASPTGR